MTVVLVALVVATLLEIGMDFFLAFWNVRKYILFAVVAGTAFGSGALIIGWPNIFTSAIFLVAGYRVFNTLRIPELRMKEQYLRRTTRQTGMWLIVLQLAVGALWWSQYRYHFKAFYWFVLLASIQLLCALVLAASTVRRFKKTSPIVAKMAYADRDLPDVTVAIPARNEDQQLEDCLHAILASDYPKLEVIVFDDNSQDKTPQIIRNFAHDGVRFIPGKEPAASWLAKNQAYEQLAQEASGDIILFCGVDVRFAPHTIRQLVALLQSRGKSMVSLLPVNERPRLSFAQSMRYYWEMALPRRMFNRPPVMSTCWLITAEALHRIGGFAAVSRSITPEAFFAKSMAKHDAYSFIRSTAHLGVSSVKSTGEQWETAIRTRYPQLHRRPELVLMVAFAELTTLFVPYVLMVIGFWDVFGIIPELLFIATCTVLAATYRSITYTTSPVNRWFVAPLFPITVLVDILILHSSMYSYEFSTVTWKGRNVSLPVMQVSPRLPKIS